MLSLTPTSEESGSQVAFTHWGQEYIVTVLPQRWSLTYHFLDKRRGLGLF